MKSRKAILGGIAVLALSGAGVPSLMAADLPDPQRQIIVELAKLRVDVLLILTETQQMKIEKLSADLHRVQQRQKELAAAEALRREQLADLDQQLASADLPEQTRPEIEAVRTGVVETMSGTAKQEQSSLEKRQAELTDQLRLETQRFTAWKQQAQLLASSAAQ
ncbi:MAG TPA: hypothetical protein VH351_23725 [Bryobacteraceae bacterium]|jgi:hypothetical protein|nr:hypothetical protein [Bryobacteraceae bacterium]